MFRSHQNIGNWRVDLALELDESDWAQQGLQLQAVKPESGVVAIEDMTLKACRAVDITYANLVSHQ